MSKTVGLRFCPTEKEICNYYLRNKNLCTDTSYVDGIISTVTNIWSLDPCDLPSLSNWRSRSTNESGNPVWYIFGVKQNHQTRTTRNGRWKKTGNTKCIKQKRMNPEQIAEKRYFVFQQNDNTTGGSKSDWVMHEYSPTFLSPNQMKKMTTTYTICKVEFKGEETEIENHKKETEIDSFSAATQLEHSHNSIPLMKNSAGIDVSPSQIVSVQNPSQFGGYVYKQKEAQLPDIGQTLWDDDWIDVYYK